MTLLAVDRRRAGVRCRRRGLLGERNCTGPRAEWEVIALWVTCDHVVCN